MSRRKNKPNPSLERQPAVASAARRWAKVQAAAANYPLLILVAVCQLLTIGISWPVWQVRSTPPLLPLIWFPEISFGVPLVISLLAVTYWPRAASIVHVALLSLAIIADQHRLQPQVISLAVLLIGCAFISAGYTVRWYLAAMWLWAGLHKFLSPEWYGFQSWWFLDQCGLDPSWHLPFAILVAVFETTIGLLAMFAPRRAAWPAVVLHAGLLVSLSPLVRNFNESVWPWNIATAAVAFWLLRRVDNQPSELPRVAWAERSAAVIMLLAPALFYVNWLNPHLAFVLYSGNMPRAIHVKHDSYVHLDGWTGQAVPFPDSPRLFVELFRKTSQPGDKLHIADPRWGLPDQYFIKRELNGVQPLAREEFWRSKSPATDTSVRPIELEDLQLVWKLRQAGYQLEPTGFEIILKAANTAPTLQSQPRDVVSLLAGLHNLRELHWERVKLSDADLDTLAGLHQLELLQLRGCELPEHTWEELKKCRQLAWIQIQGCELPTSGWTEFTAEPQLQVLRLSQTSLSDAELAQFSNHSHVTWFGFSETKVTSAGLQRLPILAKCQWLNLAGNDLDDSALVNLPQWPKLEVLNLSRTKVTDAAIPTLAKLQRCQTIFLGGTQISLAGKATLQAALPNLTIAEEPPPEQLKVTVPH
ncbi:leucine-rich repeat domain-containing protein [Anatilimnocola sp. NA78]|uniref:leucine-rich repeat domain-containing protein n=1 Tax=Anatilimnocola sp. NA78 TaxID=3415683 RepID=UPI003CE59BBE